MKTKVLIIAITLLGTILLTTANAQWQELNTGVSYDFKALSIPTPDVVWASGQDGKIIKSINGGLTWTEVSLPVPGEGQHTSWNLFAKDANVALASTIEWGIYTAHLFRTVDGGATWTEVLTQSGTMFNNVWIYPDNTAFLVGDQLGDGYWVAYKSIDGGITWIPVTIPCGPAEYGFNNSLFVRDGITYFAGTSWDFNTWTVIGTQVYKSKNLVDWEVFDVSLGNQPPNISASNCLWLNDANKCFVNGAFTVNGGKKWKPIPKPDATGILTLVGYENKLWAITNNASALNVYYTNNHGKKWEIAYSPSISGAVNNQLTGSRLFNDNIVLYLIRNNGTIAKYTESIEDKMIVSKKPQSEYKLIANYPNPFNPVTNISFKIPTNDFVSLKIYDIVGREIATLVNEVKTEGIHEVQWNASGLSSGIYFYKLTSGNFTDIKRMTLVK